MFSTRTNRIKTVSIIVGRSSRGLAFAAATNVLSSASLSFATVYPGYSFLTITGNNVGGNGAISQFSGTNGVINVTHPRLAETVQPIIKTLRPGLIRGNSPTCSPAPAWFKATSRRPSITTPRRSNLICRVTPSRRTPCSECGTRPTRSPRPSAATRCIARRGPGQARESGQGAGVRRGRRADHGENRRAVQRGRAASCPWRVARCDRRSSGRGAKL